MSEFGLKLHCLESNVESHFHDFVCSILPAGFASSVYQMASSPALFLMCTIIGEQ